MLAIKPIRGLKCFCPPNKLNRVKIYIHGSQFQKKKITLPRFDKKDDVFPNILLLNFIQFVSFCDRTQGLVRNCTLFDGLDVHNISQITLERYQYLSIVSARNVWENVFNAFFFKLENDR